MNALNRIALLAGGALVIASATGCSSATKAAVSGASATTPTNTSGAPAAPVTVTVSAPGQASSTGAPAGGASTAPAANPSSTAADGGSTTAPPAAAPTGHPACDNSKLNAALAPAGSGQKPSVAVIAVTNTGPTCTVKPLPYLWIVTSPTDASTQTRPLVPETDPAKQLIILSDTTLYAAIDLNPSSAANAAGSYGYLEVTANPTPNTSGKDVQDVRLPAPAGVSNAMLGIYTTNPSSAIDQIQYATTPEK